MLCCAMICLEMKCAVNCKGCHTIVLHTATAEAVKHEDNSPPDRRATLSIATATHTLSIVTDLSVPAATAPLLQVR